MNPRCSGPVMVSTWSFGQRANAAGWPTLAGGGAALDAVEQACRDAEEDLTNHTVGRGGYPDHTGRVSLDASIMLSPAKSGAVCGLREFSNAISIARAVMERTPHRLLCGPDADRFAHALGHSPTDLLTQEACEAWQAWVSAGRPRFPLANLEDQIERRRSYLSEPPVNGANHDTIGVLAIDARGTLAGGCTTSGLAFKLAGRVGDAPIVGQGLYVDPGAGAAVCSGMGERIVGVCAAFLAVEAMRAGCSAAEAARLVCERCEDVYGNGLGDDDQVGVLTLDLAGDVGSAAVLPGFRYAVRTTDQDEVLEPAFILRPR